MVWLMLSSGVMVTTPCVPFQYFPLQPVSLLSQVVSPFPPPLASSLHVAEGPGSPQVLHLSNKVETIKPGYQAIFLFWPQRVGMGGYTMGAKLTESPITSPILLEMQHLIEKL